MEVDLFMTVFTASLLADIAVVGIGAVALKQKLKDSAMGAFL